MTRLKQALAIGLLSGCLTTAFANPTLTPGTWKNITPAGLNPGASFGCMDIKVHPTNPNILYFTTDVQGMWKSTDGGATWKTIGNLPSPTSPGVIQINPANPLQMYYCGGVRGSSVGFYVSTDGGDHWAMPAGFAAQANNSVGGWVNDVYEVAADPNNFNHVLLSFHANWEWSDRSGILESNDGGNSWVRHYPLPLTGAGWTIWFLKKNGAWNSGTWLVGTQYNGYWRTADSGATWKQVSIQNMQHGGTSICYSNTGVLYVGALNQVLRSTDDGLTFTKVCPNVGDGYYSVIGDGNFLYTQSGNTGTATVGTKKYYTSPENDGVNWTTYNTQTFTDGPYRMAFDATNRIIYSSNWGAGIWALKVLGNSGITSIVKNVSHQYNHSASHIALSDQKRGMVVVTGKSETGFSKRVFDIRGRNINKIR